MFSHDKKCNMKEVSDKKKQVFIDLFKVDFH